MPFCVAPRNGGRLMIRALRILTAGNMNFETLGFECDYDVQLLGSLHGREPDYNFAFPRLTSEHGVLSFDTHMPGTNACILEVKTGNDNVWSGRFERVPEGISGFYATPARNTVLIVIEGRGYWVPTREPATYEVVATIPIRQVIRVPGRDIVLLVDFVRMEAYGPEGLLWQTNSLSWDGLQITEVNSTTIRGLAWDSPADSHVEFRVDTLTGVATGGSSPEHYAVTT